LNYIVIDGKQFDYDYQYKNEIWDFEKKSYRRIIFAMIRNYFLKPKNIGKCLSFSIEFKKLLE